MTTESDPVRTCVVADDEPSIASRIARLATAEGLRVLATCANGAEALDAIARLAPDIAFLDIRMPGLSGLDVLARLEAMSDPPVCVLVTAYDAHAVAAFALAAVDYVLKPVAQGRFASAVARARATVEGRDAAAQLARLRGVLADGRPDRISLRDGVRLVQLDPKAIVRVEAADDYVMLHAGGRAHLLPVRLNALEELLPAPPFLRCHRSHLINLDHVAAADPTSDGRLVLRVAGSAVPVSRGHVRALRAHLEHRKDIP